MPSGNPGQRRGARGPNGSKKAPAKKKAPTKKPAERAARRARQVKLAMVDCRLKNPGAREMAADSLEDMLAHRDLLRERVDEGTLTSEEGAVANATQRNILKWLGTMGVDSLRGEDDCAECQGSGRKDGAECEACGGSGVAE